LFCPDTDDGEQDEIAFLKILTELDQIHALRVIKISIILKKIPHITTQSLNFKPLSDEWDETNLSQDYLLRMSNQLKARKR
jgi:hypothetical protein